MLSGESFLTVVIKRLEYILTAFGDLRVYERDVKARLEHGI